MLKFSTIEDLQQVDLIFTDPPYNVPIAGLMCPTGSVDRLDRHGREERVGPVAGRLADPADLDAVTLTPHAGVRLSRSRA